jgi:hypothetical protein
MLLIFVVLADMWLAVFVITNYLQLLPFLWKQHNLHNKMRFVPQFQHLVNECLRHDQMRMHKMMNLYLNKFSCRKFCSELVDGI